MVITLSMASSIKRLQRELERFQPNEDLDISVDGSEDTLLHVNMKVRI